MTTPAPTPGNAARNSLAKVLLPIAGIIVLVVAGLFILRQQLQRPAVQEAPTWDLSHPPADMHVGAVLPDFQLHAFQGSAVPASTLKAKVSLINFWATWCEACMVEMPSIVKLHEAYKSRGLDVLAVDLDTNPATVLPHTIQKYKMGFTVYTDEDSKLADFFQVQAIPLSIVIDHNRKILLIENEGLDWNGEDFRAQLEKWLREEGVSTVIRTELPQRQLPLFLTEENKIRVLAWISGISIVMYLIPNHFHFLTPQEMPRSWFDLAVPFMPNTVWLYMSEALFFAGIYFACKNMENLNKLVYSYMALQLTSCLIFWAWPTTFPRALFPLPENLNALTAYAFNNLRQTDSPANCCPSLHVSSVYLCSFFYIDENRKYFPLFFGWASVIAISTLTTKQHYLIDVVSGFFMATMFFWVFHRRMQYRQGAQANR